MEMTAAVENLDKVLETDIMIDEDLDSLATLNIAIKPEADEVFDPHDFDWPSDVVSDESDEDFKPSESGKKRKTSKRDKVSRVPFTPQNNIKTIVTKKEILPRRKSVSAVYNYTELDIEADDTHMLSTEAGFHICHICQAKFVNKCSLTWHLKWHSRQYDSLDCMKYARDMTATLTCKECDFTSTINHQSTNTCTSHASSTEKPYACTQCNYRCVRRGHLQMHMKTHTGEKPYACTQCDYRCVQSGNLQEHMKTHTGEKPYACTQCDYRCVRRAHLQLHMKTHTGEKPYACTLCDYKCVQRGNLQMHMKTAHTGKKPYACTQCDYRCVQRGHLQMHMKTHTGEKPYACTQCDYRCVQSGNLQEHMKTHRGEKPFACTQCDYKCVRRGHLQTHMKTHTGEKPYACTKCDYRCVQNGSLQRHMTTHT